MQVPRLLQKLTFTSWKTNTATIIMSNLTDHLYFICLQCFDVVGWVSGRASGLYKIEW